jgi:hypothetical protein
MSERRGYGWGPADGPDESEQVRAALQAAAAGSPIGAWLPDVDGAVAVGRRRRRARRATGVSVGRASRGPCC